MPTTDAPDPVYPKPDPLGFDKPVPGMKHADTLEPLGPSAEFTQASGDAYEARFRRLEHRMDQLLALLRDRPHPFVEYPKQISSKRMGSKVVVNSKEEEEFHGKEAPPVAGAAGSIENYPDGVERKPPFVSPRAPNDPLGPAGSVSNPNYQK